MEAAEFLELRVSEDADLAGDLQVVERVDLAEMRVRVDVEVACDASKAVSTAPRHEVVLDSNAGRRRHA